MAWKRLEASISKGFSSNEVPNVKQVPNEVPNSKQVPNEVPNEVPNKVPSFKQGLSTSKKYLVLLYGTCLKYQNWIHWSIGD